MEDITLVDVVIFILILYIANNVGNNQADIDILKSKQKSEDL